MKRDLKLVINCQKGRTIERTIAADGKEYEKDRITLTASETAENDCIIGSLRLKIGYVEPLLEEHYNLSMETPVKIYMQAEKPEKITSLYMYGPWWSRPGFSGSFADIPDRTQVALFKYADRVGCFVPMVGDRFKSYLTGGTDTELCLVMTAMKGGIGSFDETTYVYAEADTVREAVHRVFKWLTVNKGILPREKRRLPEMFRYLGWCSWDAFYTDVSEKLLRQKADEISEKKLPVRWMLIDDGWFPSREKMITDFAPDSEKFPEGFSRMISDIKAESSIDWVGVWHALGGYWGGVDPESSLAEKEKDYLFRNVKDWLVPDYRNGSGFYRDWCRLLRSEGIEFIKVDGQSTAPFYYENDVPVAEAARGMNRALESGSFEMDGAIINCMGMAMENVLARPASAISRNSDDFFPSREESFTEHLLQNAYNSIYHDEIYCCDWDMFWTKHKFAAKHSLLRAISGGPVYFSDRIGDTVPEVLEPLCLKDGSLLMMARSARPAEDCVFTDPVKEGVLKLTNYAPYGDGYAGGIAVYNLSGREQTFSFVPEDVPELAGYDRFVIYDWFRHTVRALGKGEQFNGTAEKDGFAWYVIIPEVSRAAFLGLTDKYTGFTAVENIINGDNSQTVMLRASGKTAWVSESRHEQVMVNGIDMTGEVHSDGSLKWLELPESTERTIVTICF